MRRSRLHVLVLTVVLAGLGTIVQPAAAQVVRHASGAGAPQIQAAVDAYRADLGALNPNTPGSTGAGRREINWDAVPEGFSSPHPFPPNFFNHNLAGRARGAVFSTPGSGFQVSANAGVTPVEFGNIHPSYPTLFATFSPQKLFTAIGSNVTEVRFFVPGSPVPATSRGFGAVFTDVDGPGTKIEFFDPLGHSLGVFPVPSVAGQGTLSFLGVSFPHRIVARVRITSGTDALAHNEAGHRDLVVMDDFIYGEPGH